MLMCKHYSKALLKRFPSAYHSIKNQHTGLTVAALMQSARERQLINHTKQLTKNRESCGAEPWLCLSLHACLLGVCVCVSLTEISQQFL